MKELIKFISLLLLATLQLHAANIKIIDSDICSAYGSRMINCKPESIAGNSVNVVDYIPMETRVSLDMDGYCDTSTPMWIKVTGDGETQSLYSVFALDERFFSQSGLAQMNIEVMAPYASRTFYHKTCSITAEVNFNEVNLDELSDNLRAKKASTLVQLSDVIKLVEQQTTIISLSNAVNNLDGIVELAESDLTNFYSLTSQILQDACAEGQQCTWLGMVDVILDNNLILNVAHAQLLSKLGQRMDLLTPSSCFTEACIADLVSDDVKAIIDNAMSLTPGEAEAKADLETYVDRKLDLETLLDEYESVASDYGINWNSL